jgi:Putative Ig domain
LLLWLALALALAAASQQGCAGTGSRGRTNPLTIITSSLAAVQVGAAYSVTLQASGGTAPYNWSVSSGTLPGGLTLSTAGVVSGTPTAAGTFSFTAKVTDASSNSATTLLQVTINPATLSITTSSPLASGQVGAAYSATLQASGGTTPYSWATSGGTLPGGLTLSMAGVVSGTPTAAGTFSFTAKVTDASSHTAAASLQVTINPATLSITTTSPLGSGQVGAAYSATLQASGGTAPYNWSVSSGTLPGGLTLSMAGVVSGTPTAAGTFSFTAKVTDASSHTATASLQVTINPATLSISTSSPLGSGQVGAAYSATLQASGGTAPYNWSVSSGTLPGGLTLSTAGVVSGTPTAAGTFSFTAKVTDASSNSATKSLQVTISPATLSITTSTPLGSGQVGAAYSATLQASGGTAPYSWSVSSGTLPGGLTLSTAGVLSGTPTAAGTFSFTAKVTDASSNSATKAVQVTIDPATLSITTMSLPGGQVNVAYSTTLSATGGTPPYTWSLTSGTLPTGLGLNASTGVISGTPTQIVTNTPLTFEVKDSATPTPNQKSVSLTLTIASSSLSVSISPRRGGATVGQQIPMTATVTNDVGSAGVNWSVTSGGTLSSQTTTSAAFSASSAGVYTVTATSNADSAASASATIGVTDLTGVFTYHNDLSRDGSNPSEYALTTANVTTATFGKLFSCPVDGAVYAQPLWVANLSFSGVKHNVVFVATQADSLYAFDADTSPCVTLWHVNLIDSSHGGTAGEAPVPSGPTGFLVGGGSGDITPEVGVTGTPVIDPSTDTLYVVSKSAIASTTTFFQRLHAIDLFTGNEKFSGPVAIAATYPGTGDGTSTTTFSPQQQNQRAGLALVNGVVYIAWSSHEDTPPYYGWVMGYSAATLQQEYVLNVTPNVHWGGIWMGGGAPAADSSNNVYLLTGNGNFDANSATAPNNDYGDSFLKLSSTLTVSQYFTPSDQATDNADDADFGSGGAAILVDQPSSPVPHLVIGGGKDGYLYLLNRDAMGGYGDSSAVQRLNFGQGIFGTGAFWNNYFYLGGIGGSLQGYTFNTTSGMLNTSNVALSPETFAFPGTTPSVSSSGTNNGIVWALNNGSYCTPQSPGCGPAVLHAYEATNISSELWDSSQGTGNSAGNAVKFTVPTVANGKVYVGTRGNNQGGSDSSTSTPGELDVYGLLP